MDFSNIRIAKKCFNITLFDSFDKIKDSHKYIFIQYDYIYTKFNDIELFINSIENNNVNINEENNCCIPIMKDKLDCIMYFMNKLLTSISNDKTLKFRHENIKDNIIVENLNIPFDIEFIQHLIRTFFKKYNALFNNFYSS